MSGETPEHPPGDYAIVELFGHTTLVGRIQEVERFGTKMLAMEPLFDGTLLDVVFHGGAAIYRLTPCSAAIAFARQPRSAWQLPPAIRVLLPDALLETSATDIEADVPDADEYDEPERGG